MDQLSQNEVSNKIPTSQIKIAVPWGVIAGKTWGYPNASPVLCVHGLQSNANSFDTLIPLLPSSYYYVAIDLPSHGLSSRFPDGRVLYLMDFMESLSRVINHFGWKKCDYMAHSIGGVIGLLYASFYPERISKVVVLDSFLHFPKSISDLMEQFCKNYEKLYNLESRMASTAPPEYTKEEVLRRVMEGQPTLDREAAEIILERALVKNGQGYYFSADQRLKMKSLDLITEDKMCEILNHLRCPLLFVRATQTLDTLGTFYTFGNYDDLLHKNLGEKYIYKIVEGSHDLHLMEPEKVSTLITNFLVSQKSSL